jgi:hypothetical protein
MSHKMCDTWVVGDSITVRLDADAARALRLLTRGGVGTSRAVRDALVLAAERRERAELRAEAEALAADPVDRAEVTQILKDMEELRAW